MALDIDVDERAERRLMLKPCEAGSSPGAIAYFLCDAQGRPLPGQAALSFEQRHGEISKITVEFNVDGVDVCLASETVTAIIGLKR